MINNITHVNFTDYGIEIFYGDNQVFRAYKDGGDLSELDEFLSHLSPEIDFDRIDTKSALRLERRLYRELASCRTKKLAVSVVEGFAAYVKKAFSRKGASNNCFSCLGVYA